MRVHFLGGQKIPWALDEDLRWARQALAGPMRFSPLAFAGVVHAAWWPAVLAAGPAALRGKFVACFADNPPAFYLTRPDFRRIARRVDLWIARTREAREQFEVLGLPARTAPYCVDPGVFRPTGDREAIRRGLGIPPDAFVIGNFHRDSEGSNLARPKMQKGPDLFFEIAKGLHGRIPALVVLLAGPRRHWLRRALGASGIRVVFHGKDTGDADDFGVNILPREELNRLYQALDVCVISSRWEGGPYSVLEALFAGRPVISTPVGTSRDVLDSSAIFADPHGAVALLEDHFRTGSLAAEAGLSRMRVLASHTPAALGRSLREIHAAIPGRDPGLPEVLRSLVGWILQSRWSDEFPSENLIPEPAGSTFWPASGGNIATLTSCARAIASCSMP
ncbi:MAG: glycosyltransferase family 4 protein [Terrimicrobiaceae bacterium]